MPISESRQKVSGHNHKAAELSKQQTTGTATGNTHTSDGGHVPANNVYNTANIAEATAASDDNDARADSPPAVLSRTTDIYSNGNKTGEPERPASSITPEANLSKTRNNLSLEVANKKPVQPANHAKPQAGNRLDDSLRHSLLKGSDSKACEIRQLKYSLAQPHMDTKEKLRANLKTAQTLNQVLKTQNDAVNEAIEMIKKDGQTHEEPRAKIKQRIAALRDALSPGHEKMLEGADKLHTGFKPSARLTWREVLDNETIFKGVLLSSSSVVASCVMFALLTPGILLLVPALFLFNGATSLLRCITEYATIKSIFRQLPQEAQGYTKIRQNLAPSC